MPAPPRIRCSIALVLLLFLSAILFVGCGSTSSNSTSNSGTSGASTPGGSSAGSGGNSGGGSSGGSGSGSGSGTSNSFVSYVYSAGTSAIIGYGVNSDGSLKPLAGSPYSASLGQNSSIVTNGANLYAIAGGSTNLDVFSIDKSSGSLTLANTTNAIAGDPHQGDMASNLALDHTGGSLYVDVGLSDIVGGVNVFTVGSASSAQQLQYFAGPAIALPPPVFSPNNQYGYTSSCSARVEGVFRYTRSSNGTLTEISSVNPPPPTGNPGEAFCPKGIAASAKGYLAVVWFPFAFASSGPVGNETYVVTYTINGDGTLSPVSNSQMKTTSTSANTVVTNFDPTGSVLAAAGDGGVQTFTVNSNGTLAAAGSPQNAGVQFQNVAWDNSNHVFATSSSQLYVFSSSNGVLTPASGSPYTGASELTVLPLN